MSWFGMGHALQLDPVRLFPPQQDAGPEGYASRVVMRDALFKAIVSTKRPERTQDLHATSKHAIRARWV
jgi:hypothetical protein